MIQRNTPNTGDVTTASQELSPSASEARKTLVLREGTMPGTHFQVPTTPRTDAFKKVLAFIAYGVATEESKRYGVNVDTLETAAEVVADLKNQAENNSEFNQFLGELLEEIREKAQELLQKRGRTGVRPDQETAA